MFERIKLALMRSLFGIIVIVKWRGKAPTGVRCDEHSIAVAGGTVGARVYRLDGKTGPAPVILFFHGGGWIGGNTRTHDPFCRDLCVKTGYLVVSVNYRLAPEHPFPCAPQDCMAALRWLREQAPALGADLQQLVLCGDSAGGNLAAVVAIQARDEFPGLVKGQVLIYPVTDHCRANTASAREFAQDRVLNQKTLAWIWDTYLRGHPLAQAEVVEHDLATPLRVRDLRGLPPALVLLAERDPLRDEGVAYARRLQEQGVAVQYTVYPQQHHGFIGVEGRTAGHETAMKEITGWLAANRA